MKRIVVMMCVLAMLIVTLGSCKVKMFDPVDYDTEVTTEYTAPTVEGNYDDDGNVNLVSSENRKVYAIDGGYVAFSFLGEAVQTITLIYEYETEEAAREAVMEKAQVYINKGEVPPTFKTEGVYVLVTVGYSKDDAYGKYYVSNKTEVIKNFGTALGDESAGSTN